MSYRMILERPDGPSTEALEDLLAAAEEAVDELERDTTTEEAA